MVLWHGITGITWLCGGTQKSLMAWSGPAWDNPEMRAGGYGAVMMAALSCPARR